MPSRPDAVVDLQTPEGVALVGGSWRFHDTRVEEVDFVDVGPDLGPGTTRNRTYRVVPEGGGTDVDDAGWRHLAPHETQLRLSTGRVCFAWYRILVTLPERLGDLDVTGCTVVFECVVDDAAEIWVDGRLPLALGLTGGQVAGGFNAPNRVVLTRDARPGQSYTIAVFGINGPISAAPANYIWMRTATLDVYRPEQARVGEPVDATVRRLGPGLDDVLEVSDDGRLAAQRVAGGFVFTEGPLWTSDGALLFSSPNTNTIYRWSPDNGVSVFMAKSGYTGVDIGRYSQPGSNGLARDPQGRLVICQHGNRRLLRVEPHGSTTVLADSFGGRRLNSPNDVVVGADGTIWFTDPPFGLPDGPDDPKRELPAGVYRLPADPPIGDRPDAERMDGDRTAGGQLELVTDELAGPNGIALSPDGRWLYVGNWDPARSVVLRYPLLPGGRTGPGRQLADLTGEPGEGSIDGLAVDTDGHLFVCGPGGIWVLDADGNRLGLVGLPESPHNLAWGDDDARTLYVTAESSIYRFRTRTRTPGYRPTR
jgi:gluconolactonase